VRGQQVVTELVVDDARANGRLTVLELSWWSSDPLAVVFTMISKPDHPALPGGTWVAPRDIVRAGLRAPAGNRDVRLEPAGDDRVLIHLAGAGRLSDVELDAAATRGFLERTERVVPPGAEVSESELDTLLADLLGA
jgi:Streptomyces sporulation and cell division protein, SsgA